VSEGKPGDRRRPLLGPALLLAFGAVLLVEAVLLFPRKPTPLSGELKVYVWSEQAGKKGWEVRQPGALPVRNGEQIQIEARLDRPAHVYLLWIDSEGDLTPMYPWNQGNVMEVTDASAPPPRAAPCQELLSPPGEGKGWKMAGPSGLETIVLLARHTPLPAEVNLAERIGKQKRLELSNPQEVVVRGFDHGEPVPAEKLPADLFRGLGREAVEVDEALSELMQRLKDDFELIRLVQFAHQGQ